MYIKSILVCEIRTREKTFSKLLYASSMQNKTEFATYPLRSGQKNLIRNTCYLAQVD
jgi:hypothetical protein